jgi:glycosyltransferase involved in cell wall biosynthesis
MLRVSTLVTVYNEPAAVAQAVTSLAAQSFANVEILVVDDGSTDATSEVLAAISDPRLRVLTWGRLGRAEALRRGCEAARGRYIAILDADDVAYSTRLEKQAAFLDSHPDVAWVGCGEERVDTQRGEHAERLYPADDRAIRRLAARCIPYSHSGVMFRRSLIDEGLNYDPDQPFLIDFEFFLRVAARHRVANLPEVLVRRHLRDDSFFQSRFKRSRQNRALARLGLVAVFRLGLPPWYAAFPLARLVYLWLPDAAKRVVRRGGGLAETYRSGEAAR